MSKATKYCKNVFDGTHDTPKPTKSGFKLLTSKNILNGKLDKEDAYYISKEDYDAVNQRSQVKQWDVLFSMIGTVGNVCLITDSNVDFAIKNMGDFSCEDENKAKWLYYYLQSPYIKKLIQNYLNGAVQKFLPLGWLRNLDIPDYDDNKKVISDILWYIDTKISNNTSICSTLEAMSKSLYNYWFVQFDFPDENGKPYKSSGGKMVWNEELKREIPEGWEVKKLGEKCQCLLGGTPSRDKPEYWGGNINWINSGTVNEFRISSAPEKITEEGLNNTSTYLMPRNTTVLAITGATLGQVSILNIDACANQSVVGILETEEVPTEFIYPSVVSSMKQLMNQQTGAAQPHVNKQDIMGMTITFPPKPIMDSYISSVKDMYASIMELCLENQQLASLRDFLLPMLMNGQVKVGKGDE